MVRTSINNSAGVRAIDLFCGAGGSSWGAKLAGAEVVAGFDKWDIAGDAYSANFPDAWFFEGRLEDWTNRQLRSEIKDINLLIASPECTNHSPAKGNSPRCEKSKETAFHVIRFAKVFEPRWIIVENVVNMRNWSRYDEFLDDLIGLGYHVSPQVLDSSLFGVPQTRRRLFLLCDREREPASITSNFAFPIPASSIIVKNSEYRFTPLRQPGRADATLARAERAMDVVGTKRPFLIVYYGSDHAGGWQRLTRPLRTITTLDRFAYVKVKKAQHFMRMLQVPELKAAMGMPMKFSVKTSSRRDSIKLLGNAVCPPVMRAAVRGLTRQA
ncbi:Modification methylase HhaI [Symmachiella dynata]|uniref:DNA (cytosine-5-)-methyltransferase n=1 Tax=Symmachiella dynata TaxID=2527995 RepID=A0A517ZYM8_9PLAN|nr:DNA cytosine methyltransferase [Symmachiella dynata]QDU47594.1 Modification methylase HhaI [Symmachiella dynata]